MHAISCSLSSLFKTVKTKTLLRHNAVKMLLRVNAGTRKEIKTQMIFKKNVFKKKTSHLQKIYVYICIKDNRVYMKGKKKTA